MASGVGKDAIDFGTGPSRIGHNAATLVITGQAGITAAAHVEAWLQGDNTSDYSTNFYKPYEHMFLSNYIGFACGDIVPGVGFTIYAFTQLRLDGALYVHWVWST